MSGTESLDTPDDDVGAWPVLYLTQTVMMTWEQHAPGGCRCVCRIYHDDRIESGAACLAPAEPGRLLRVVASESPFSASEISEPLPICMRCYSALLPLTSPPSL